MSADGVLSVIGPLADPVRNDCPGPGRCGCRDDYGQSCSSCDGSARDGSVVVLAMATYREQHPRSAA